MEADWEIEIGDGAPVIDACWEGFVDLRQDPERAVELPETKELMALAHALASLNGPSSPVWTSKCDVWRPEAFDADELDAPAEAAKFAVACYIDLLPVSDRPWLVPGQATDCCRKLCERFHTLRRRCCRADLVVRRAYIVPGRGALGITAYFTACGPAIEDARSALASALAIFVEALLHEDAASTLQW